MASSHHSSPRPFQRLKQLLYFERRDLRVVVLFALFISILSLVTPITIEALVTTVTFGVAIWPVIWLAIAMLFCLGLAAVITAAETRIVEHLQQRLFIRVVSDFAHRIPRVPLEAFDEQHGPSLLNRFFDLIVVQKAASFLLLDGTRLVIATVVGLAVLGFYHPLLLAFAIGLIILILVMVGMGYGGVRSSIAESQAKYDMAEWLQSLARSPTVFKTGIGPQLALDRTNQLARDYVDFRRMHFRIVFRQICFALFIQVISSVLLLSLGGYLVIQQQLTLGQLIAAELILAVVVRSLSKLGKYLDAWYDLMTGVEKLGVVTDLAVERLGGVKLIKTDAGMRLSFRGDDQGEVFTIEPNERVALVGRSGLDITRLLEILGGLRVSASEQVRMDGIDLNDLNLSAMREQVALVHRAEIFPGTISDNFRAGRSMDLVDERRILLVVNLLEVAAKLPDGMQTWIQPTGLPLTENQALRLVLARALAAKPRLLILDGVLDAIDEEDCPELLPFLFDRANGWSLLLVGHNESVRRRCDRVIALS